MKEFLKGLSKLFESAYDFLGFFVPGFMLLVGIYFINLYSQSFVSAEVHDYVQKMVVATDLLENKVVEVAKHDSLATPSIAISRRNTINVDSLAVQIADQRTGLLNLKKQVDSLNVDSLFVSRFDAHMKATDNLSTIVVDKGSFAKIASEAERLRQEMRKLVQILNSPGRGDKNIFEVMILDFRKNEIWSVFLIFIWAYILGRLISTIAYYLVAVPSSWRSGKTNSFFEESAWNKKYADVYSTKFKNLLKSKITAKFKLGHWAEGRLLLKLCLNDMMQNNSDKKDLHSQIEKVSSEVLLSRNMGFVMLVWLSFTTYYFFKLGHYQFILLSVTFLFIYFWFLVNYSYMNSDRVEKIFENWYVLNLEQEAHEESDVGDESERQAPQVDGTKPPVVTDG